VLGIVLYVVLRMSNPDALERVSEVYGGDATPPERTTY
jgi:hypothetical protein